MEYLGCTFDSPQREKKSNNWKPVEITFEEQEEFHIATSKIIKTFKHPDGDGKCVVSDSDGNKYMLDVVHATYDIYSNSIKVFPLDCRQVNK